MQERSSLQITWHVWHAVFMREIMARITADRMATPWLIIEPLIYIGLMIGVRKLMSQNELIPGADVVGWLLLGIMAFYLFRDALTRSMHAIEANHALFAYRQVHPFDPVFIRAIVELLLRTAVLFLLLFFINLFGHEMLPIEALRGLEAWLALWVLGFGLALILSVAMTVLPEIGKVVPLLMLPMYVLSGVMIPLQFLPYSLRESLAYNPLVHGIEAVRLSFYPTYHVPYPIDMTYLWFWACNSLLFGFILHVRYKRRLTAQ